MTSATPYSRSQSSYLPILSKPGPFTDPDYTAEFGSSQLNTGNTKVLVIGAGGLGCEILKNLSLSGFKHIECIDMDTIDLTNLNRQFLFRFENVGESKAEVACQFITNRINDPNLKIIPHYAKIQDFDVNFYRSFDIIVCGLDNIEARRWINQTLILIASVYEHYIPWIDGGTEGFQGSVKVMIPTITACFECYLKLVPKQTTYPLCTLASTPRLPEHCIEWAHQLEWGRQYPGVEFDADVADHVEKMYLLSKTRADKFGIQGVTKSKTLGVVKNIIPAIASTNAIIAAACCNECFKFVTSCNPNLKDSMYYNGENGVVAVSDPYHKIEDCSVCGNLHVRYEIDNQLTLIGLVNELKLKYDLLEPVMLTGDGTRGDLYNDKPKESGKYTQVKDDLVVDLLPFGVDGSCETMITMLDKNRAEPLKLMLLLKKRVWRTKRCA